MHDGLWIHLSSKLDFFVNLRKIRTVEDFRLMALFQSPRYFDRSQPVLGSRDDPTTPIFYASTANS
jgi:hypothetical protein